MLTTVEKLKSILGESPPEDGLLQLYILSASTKIENRCKRSFRKQTYTQRMSGGLNSKYINLRNYPILSILDIQDDSGAVSGFEILDEGRIFNPNGWSCGENNLTVTYIGGYVLPDEATSDNPATLPSTLEMACLLFAQNLMRNPGVTSERVGDISVTYSGDSGEGIPSSVLGLISDHIGGWV